MNPAWRGHFRNQVFRVLDIVLEHRNHRGVLLREELLRHRSALLAHTHLLRMEQKTLYIARGVSTHHQGHRKKRACLGTNLATIVLKRGLITQNGICINGRIIETEALTRIDEELVNRYWIDAGGSWDEIRRHITAGSGRLCIK